MSVHVYILRCSDGSYCTGHAEDLESRIAQHQAGEIEGFSQNRRPVELAWSQEFPDILEALATEREVRDWSRKKKEALFRGDEKALAKAALKSLPRYAGATSAPGESPAEGIAPPPVLVLVRPQLGENIGKAARAMLNFGLVDLRLVAPRDGWPNPNAGPAASGADLVLEKAQVFDTVADAVADCAHVYATTVRKRGVVKPVVTPEVAARAIHAASHERAAILFGPERSGLESDDVAVARTIVTVPINPQFGSLNLAQAVMVVAYEWSKGVGLASPPRVEIDPPGSHEELEGMLGQLDAMLEETGFFFPPDRTPLTKRTLRTILTKPGWSSHELRTLRGVWSALGGKKRPRN